MQQLLAISFLTGVEQIKWSRYNLKYHKTPEKTMHQCRVDITIMQQKWKSVLTNLFLCSDVFTYATVILDCPALSKDRTMRRKVSENSMQGSVSVEKNIIEMTLGAFGTGSCCDKRWNKEHQWISTPSEFIYSPWSASSWILDPDPIFVPRARAFSVSSVKPKRSQVLVMRLI